jgi:hypothetical protein
MKGMNLDKLYKDLGFDVETQDPMEFKQLENVVQLPFNAFSASQSCIDTHIYNLIECFGKEAVVDVVIKRIKGGN